MIKVERVSKSFSGTVVLRDLSFEVAQGETLALLGLSGSGKTTALKLVCGLQLPDSGTVVVDHLTVTAANLAQIRRRLGYVIQDGGLFPHLTAWQNISVVGREASLSNSAIQERIEALALLTKIPLKLLDRYPRELSGGQRQRIGIMRALLLDPGIILMDEPMGALDPITRKDLQEELKELFLRLKKTVVLVTHDLFEASFLSDRIILLNGGLVAQTGTMRELLLHPADDFVRRFVLAQQHHGEEGRVPG